ncbi:MAG: hypothetical protein HYT77_06830 [Deltaproteobacteria bacterium]|nr:hypothetical protein [Deltaproteobacteria bacterium]
MKTRQLLFVLPATFFLGLGLVHAQSVAVYPVKTEGFELNQSEVLEMHRIAMQACYDAGLKCSGRGQTTASVQREQQFTGGGQIAGAQYISECVLVGKTEDRFNVGLKNKSLKVLGGGFKKVGGITLGGGTQLETSGLHFGGGGMNLACQFSSTADGTLVYSESEEKMGFSGALVLAEGKSSNVKKLQKSFKKIFEHAKPKLASQ